MYGKVKDELAATLKEIEEQGLWKEERIIVTPQSSEIKVSTGEEVLNFCANNYLGLSDNPKLVQAAKDALDRYGFGMSSVRFICGTLDVHKALEAKVAEFLGLEDAILYSSCYDANGGLFETLLTKDDAVISDQLNHASIIDGIRLCKAKRYRYNNADMGHLEEILNDPEVKGSRRRMICSDGVFSMDGNIAPFDKIVELAEKYECLTMIDDSHATGFTGKTGRGTPEHNGVHGKVDIITSTLGKAMGGASGGFTASSKEIVEILRQRSRPYLFSNSLAPMITATALATFEMLIETTELRDRLEENTMYFREQMTAAGFDIKPGVHAIVPIMLGDAKLANDMARDMLEEGIYVIGFSYPVVPKGAARIRVQISGAHTREQLDRAIGAFTKIGKKYGVIK
ncbi:MAG: glycine C-acetyltransferase [Planctomycetota bacterium]|nr:MAG: glycine C-acetyltransferase [Planctomycetota bacterium]